jgi:Planctomycete cytochrome C
MDYRRSFTGGICIALLAACAARQTISYQRDVYPLLETNCLACHQPPDGKGYLKTRLSMESYQSLMQGTLYGPVIVPGDSRKSIFNMLVEGRADASLRMPHRREEPLTAQEIETLRLWVDQGARDN